MGTATAAAEYPLNLKKEDMASSLNITMVGAIADKGAMAATGTGKMGRLHALHKIIIEFLRNRVAFADK